MLRRAATFSSVFLLAACATPSELGEADGAWVGTITTDGKLTTVVNEAGSVWGGSATLVEEASIGVGRGPDEYMFGQVDSIYATDDRIYVVDSQVPAVRVYDRDGSFIQNLGAEGQGPGEYSFPTIVAADGQGRVFVLDARRINVYSATGEAVGTWPFPNQWCCVWPMYPLAGDAVWAAVREGRGVTNARFGVQAVGPNGTYGDITWIPHIDYARATYAVAEGAEATAPFSPFLIWTPAPDGRLLVGANDTYRFEVHHPDGSKQIVERFWDPVPVPVEHREWERRLRVAAHGRASAARRAQGLPGEDAEFAWDGAEIPGHKPAYAELIPALSGETWVVGWGDSVRLADCAEDPVDEGFNASMEQPCWDNERIVHVFDADGRYLGEVAIPDGVAPSATTFSPDDRRIVTVMEDANGVSRVKRYRLVLPGEEGH